MTGPAVASAPGGSPAGALPVIPASAEPPAVRDGSPAAKRAWREGLAFEEMLLEELAQSLSATAGASGEGEEGSEGPAGAGTEAQGAGGLADPLTGALLPRALAEGLVRGGGIGLAAKLAETIDPAKGAGGHRTEAHGAQALGAGAQGAGPVAGGAQAPSASGAATGAAGAALPGRGGGAQAPAEGGER
jgi:hypothetical protein